MSMDETVTSEDGSEVAAGYEPEHAFDVAPGAPVTPTQIAEPLQAALRTLVQASMGALVAYVAGQLGGADDPALAQALGVVVAAIVARVMAVPMVNDALSKIGLGASRG